MWGFVIYEHRGTPGPCGAWTTELLRVEGGYSTEASAQRAALRELDTHYKDTVFRYHGFYTQEYTDV